MARTGRPKKEINQKQFETLCRIQCTEEEIVDVLEVSVDTLNRWCRETYKDEHGKGMTFSKVFQVKRQGGKASLRANQWRLSEKNATMAIWLGKQYLGQKDQPDESIDYEDSDAYFEAAEMEGKNEVV